MAKGQGAKAKSVSNRHLHARISYLYQAATYLSVGPPDCAIRKATPTATRDVKNEVHHASSGASHGQPPDAPAPRDLSTFDSVVDRHVTSASSRTTAEQKRSGLGQLLVSQLRSVSLKGQVRLSRDLKRSICKCCNAVLVPGRTSTTTIENESKGRRKPWADVFVVECTTCGIKKRFPVGGMKRRRNKDPVQPPSSTSAVGTLIEGSAG